MSGNYPWIMSGNYPLVYYDDAEKLRFIGILAYPKINCFDIISRRRTRPQREPKPKKVVFIYIKGHTP